MSSKKYLPELWFLEETLREEGLSALYYKYGKFESLIGPVDSCDWVEEKRQEYLELKARLSILQVRYVEYRKKKGLFNWIYAKLISREIKNILKKL